MKRAVCANVIRGYSSHIYSDNCILPGNSRVITSDTSDKCVTSMLTRAQITHLSQRLVARRQSSLICARCAIVYCELRCSGSIFHEFFGPPVSHCENSYYRRRPHHDSRQYWLFPNSKTVERVNNNFTSIIIVIYFVFNTLHNILDIWNELLPTGLWYSLAGTLIVVHVG